MKKLIFFVILSCLSGFLFGQKYILNSPDNNLNVEIEIEMSFGITLSTGENTIVKPGNISLETGSISKQGHIKKVKNTVRRSVNETVRPEIREKAESFNNKCSIPG